MIPKNELWTQSNKIRPQKKENIIKILASALLKSQEAVAKHNITTYTLILLIQPKRDCGSSDNLSRKFSIYGICKSSSVTP